MLSRQVMETFCEEDARIILQIPLPDGAKDFIAWYYDDKGQHSVKQTYKLCVQTEEH
jgi:hypothetical protein